MIIKLFGLFVGAAFVNNFVLARFLGVCPVLGVSKRIYQALGMGFAVLFVMLASAAVTYPLQMLLNSVNLGFLQTVAFILVIATLVQLAEIVMRVGMPSLHKSLGVYLPLITTNCAVLGVVLDNISENYSFAEGMANTMGAGVGFLLAMVLFAAVRGRIDEESIPKALRGIPVALIAASLVAMTFLGFSGIV